MHRIALPVVSEWCQHHPRIGEEVSSTRWVFGDGRTFHSTPDSSRGGYDHRPRSAPASTTMSRRSICNAWINSASVPLPRGDVRHRSNWVLLDALLTTQLLERTSPTPKRELVRRFPPYRTQASCWPRFSILRERPHRVPCSSYLTSWRALNSDSKKQRGQSF